MELCTHVAEGSRLVALDDAARCQLHQHAFDMEIDVSVIMKGHLLVWGPADVVLPGRPLNKLVFGHENVTAHPELWMPWECTSDLFRLIGMLSLLLQHCWAAAALGILSELFVAVLLLIGRALHLQGLRVLGVAIKTVLKPQMDFSVSDERDLVFRGYLAFLDPPKETAAPAMEQLASAGVQLKVRRHLWNLESSLCWWLVAVLWIQMLQETSCNA